LSRSTFYYEPAAESGENLRLMGLIDRQYTERPFLGSRRMTAWLNMDKGEAVNRKRVQRLMRLMGLEAIYPKPSLSGGRKHKVYPYLLRGVAIERADQVWSSDITYVGLPGGFMYLAAVIDWHSRYVLSWELSNTLDGSFCLDALEAALTRGKKPEVFNTDQGVQFTAEAFTGRLLRAGVAVSMDGKGRCLDNVFVERMWRSVKYEDVYLKRYETVPQLKAGLSAYFGFYNHRRRHQSLDYRTPAEVYAAG
jgi:putative transposase